MTHPYQTEQSIPQQENDEISISDYLIILLDEWPTLVIPTILVILITGLYLLLAVPSYVATGVIQVSTQDNTSASAVLELTGIGSASPTETEVEILRSHYIVRQAANSLNLNISQPVPKLTFDLGVSLFGKSPINPTLQTLRTRIKQLTVEDWLEHPVGGTFVVDENGALKVSLGNRETETIKPGGIYSQGGIQFTYVNGEGLPRKEIIEVSVVPDDQLTSQLLQQLSVVTIGGRKETNLVKISFSHVDRTIAKQFINNMMTAYMTFALDWRTMRADKSAAFIENQLDNIRRTLETTEIELQRFLEKSGAVLLPDQAKELIHVGSEMEFELRKVRIQEDVLAQVASQLNRAQKKGTSIALTGDFLYDDQLMGQAIAALNELEIKRETLLADLTPTHPDIRKLEDEIRRMRAQILEFINASKQRIKERRKGINKALDDIQDQLASFPDKERKMAALRRNQEVGQELYTFLMTKLEESRILKASTTTDKRIIDEATTPFKKSRPKRGTTLILATFFGLILGVGIVFLRRAMDPKIRDEEEAKQLTGLPVHGVIPNLKDLGIDKADVPTIEQIWDAPKGPAAESFRTLRTNVEFSQVQETPIKVIQITSSEASEGKSTVISNLAISLTKAGHKVVLADLDLRRPTQHRIWSIPRSPGMSDMLVGRETLKLRSVKKWDMNVVSAGHEPPESQRLLSSEALANLVAEWREKFDYVLLDTPPLLVSDSLVISKLSDLMLFVVRPKSCRRASLKLAGMTHKKMDLIKGLVINGVATRRGGYYHYYRGSYYGSKTTDTQER